jgi:hypothetical protein
VGGEDALENLLADLGSDQSLHDILCNKASGDHSTTIQETEGHYYHSSTTIKEFTTESRHVLLRTPTPNNDDTVNDDLGSDDETVTRHLDEILKYTTNTEEHANVETDPDTAMLPSTSQQSSLNHPFSPSLEDPLNVLGSIQPSAAQSTAVCSDSSYHKHNNNHYNNKTRDDTSDLSDRFFALTLPSIPAHVPKKNTSRLHGADIESNWCCICNDDVAVICLDCDGHQLFCGRCWLEMHSGEGGNWELRRHRSAKYQK